MQRGGFIIMIRLEGDLHTHTISSGHAYSTLDELARAAKQKGLKLIAITDHGPNMPGGPHEYYFGNMVILPRKISGVDILKGIEANILNDGKLDLSENTLQQLDFVTAGIHADTGHTMKTREEFTEATIKAMENPLVKMITHPVNVKFPVDIEKIVYAARENGVILEVNASSYSILKRTQRGIMTLDIKMCKLSKKYGVPLALNSDAHYQAEVGDITALKEIIEKAHLTEREIINTSRERLLNFLYPELYKNQLIV
jgi:putative hydrolase